jgi:hypothetical protein
LARQRYLPRLLPQTLRHTDLNIGINLLAPEDGTVGTNLQAIFCSVAAAF